MLPLLALAACTSHGTTDGERPPGTPAGPAGVEQLDPNEETPPEPPILGRYDELLDPSRLQDIRLTIAPEDIAALDANGRAFVPATFEHDGNELLVGVHLKGSSTYQDFSRKPAFRLKFDEYVPDQAYAGLKRLALNNLTGDPAQGREVVAYVAWAQGGHPAPRASQARVYVNDEYYGLYALVEAVDRTWARRTFPEGEGDLWVADDDADLTPAAVGNFLLAAGDGQGPVTPLQASEALAGWAPEFFAQVDPVVDTDVYLDFVAWSIATGGEDGYPWHMNDYFLYANPGNGGRLVFVPWGQDESWSDLWTFSYGGGVLGWKCEADPACVAELRARIDAALVTLEETDLAAVADTIFTVSRDAVEADVRSPYTPTEVAAARAALLQRIADWPVTVRAATGL